MKDDNKNNNTKLSSVEIVILIIAAFGLIIMISDIAEAIDETKKNRAEQDRWYYEHIQKGADEYNRNHPAGNTSYNSYTVGDKKKSYSTNESKSTSSSSSSKNKKTSTKKRATSTKTVDPMDHDIDTYYEDYKDEFEDEDDAWDDFEDNDEYWDDY